MKWIVQTNLGSMVETSDNIRIEKACEKYGYKFEGIKVIPFSGEIPKFNSTEPTIFYGGTGWVNNIYNKHPNHKGIFFNPESVFTKWNKEYKEASLNYNAIETTFNKIVKENYSEDKIFFIRPISDQKEFSGGLMKFGDIKLWRDKILTGNINLGDLPIIIGEPYVISHEWRLFILNKKVISGSQYRTYSVRNVKPNLPQEVIDFAEKQADIYSPSDIFVMDICKSGKGLYVLEVGCFNSAGFYASNIEEIVRQVSNYVESRR